jgi:S-formylglutathione hydrolase
MKPVGKGEMEILSETKCFGGRQRIVRHDSDATGTPMRVSIFLPPAAETTRVPVLYFLSGLTCTEENFTVKAGAQRTAAEAGLALIAPDTSPRGLDLPGEHEDWDFGSGAGFYVNATEAPWKHHYRMYEYVTEELPRVVAASQPIDVERASISGHSMGGHGALVIGLRHPDRYASISAFAPIVSPTRCPWGERAFSAYLGTDRATWDAWDASRLVAHSTHPHSILIDQGSADGFLEEQLKPHLFEEACRASGQALELRLRDGYDHSYYFIATFMGDHVTHAAAALA